MEGDKLCTKPGNVMYRLRNAVHEMCLWCCALWARRDLVVIVTGVPERPSEVLLA